MSNINGESDVPPTESETTGTGGNVSHGSRETPATSTSSMGADRSEKARGHKSDRHVAGESDRSIVPQKPANKGSVPLPEESVEGRGLAKENVE
jgi:RNA-directed DNA polymerase